MATRMTTLRGTTLAALTALALLGSAPAMARPRQAAPNLKLRQVTVKGKQYYATYRVCSRSRANSLMDTGRSHRFAPSNNVWQYGSGFYLFGSLRDARTFVSCSRDAMSHMLVKEPRARVKARDTILQVLIPKERFDRAAKAEIKRGLDWAVDSSHPGYNKREQLRRKNEVLYGRWAEDPKYPVAANKPLVGRPQLAVIKTGAGSMLEQALVRTVEPRARVKWNKSARPRWRRPTLPKLADGLRGRERVEAISSRLRARHGQFHSVLEGKVDRHQGRRALAYLKQKFPHARAYFGRASGTPEGFTVEQHTLRAYNVLGSQLRHLDLSSMGKRYPGVNIKRTLQLALLLHDIGKPVAIDKARGLLERTLVAGKELDDAGRKSLRHHSLYSRRIMSRMMWELGCNRSEIRLARSLVSSRGLGQLMQGKTNMTGARDEIKQLAHKSGFQPGDYFQLQSLFYAADAGSYRRLRRSVFERRADGRMTPGHVGYQNLEMQLR